MEKVHASKWPRYDAAFRAEALRLAAEGRSTQAAARALNINAKLLYQWQKAAQAPLPADPAKAAVVEIPDGTIQYIRRFELKRGQPPKISYAADLDFRRKISIANKAQVILVKTES